MSNSEVIVSSDLSDLIKKREKLWTEFDQSQSFASTLHNLSAQIPNCAPAEPQLKFGAGSNAPFELQTIVPKVRERIDEVKRLKLEMEESYGEIATIKQKQKTIVIGMVIAGAALFLILVIVILVLLSSSAS